MPNLSGQKDNEELEKAIADVVVSGANFFMSNGPTGQRRTVKKEIAAIKEGDLTDAAIQGVNARAKATVDLVTCAIELPIAIPAEMLVSAFCTVSAVVCLPFSRKESKKLASTAGAASANLFFRAPRMASDAVGIVAPEVTALCRSDLTQSIPAKIHKWGHGSGLEQYGYDLDTKECRFVPL